MKKQNYRKYTEGTALKYCRQLRKNSTKPEKKVKKMLSKLGINFKFQWIFHGERRFVIVDFYLPEFGVVLEVDGKEHQTEDAIIYDGYRTKFLMNRCKIKEVIRFSNEKVLKEPHKIEQILVDRFVELDQDYFSVKFRETISR